MDISGLIYAYNEYCNADEMSENIEKTCKYAGFYCDSNLKSNMNGTLMFSQEFATCKCESYRKTAYLQLSTSHCLNAPTESGRSLLSLHRSQPSIRVRQFTALNTCDRGIQSLYKLADLATVHNHWGSVP